MVVEKIAELLGVLMKIDKEEIEAFFESENGLLILRYLLEQV